MAANDDYEMDSDIEDEAALFSEESLSNRRRKEPVLIPGSHPAHPAHALACLVPDYPNGGVYVCDVCNATQPGGTDSYHCEECSFDMCGECFSDGGVPLEDVNDDGEVVFSLTTEDGGDSTLAIRPWLGAIKEPSNHGPIDAEAVPSGDLVLEHVYGYRGADCRNNLFEDANGRVVYPCAGVVVILDPTTGTQTFYRGHTDDVISLELCEADGLTFASGQVGRYAPIHIWRSDDPGTTIAVLDGHKSGVNSLSYNADGTRLASVSVDEKHTLCVWDTSSYELIARADHPAKIMAVGYNPVSDEIVTAGKRGVYFWTLSGGSLSKTTGKFGGKGDSSYYLTVGFTEKGSAIIGSQDGQLCIFVGSDCKKVVDAHAGPVFCMGNAPDRVLLTGGKDGVIKHWDSKFNCIDEVDAGEFSSPVVEAAEKAGKSVPAKIRAVWYGQGGLLIGTKRGEVFQHSPRRGANQLAYGHFSGEVWGLATNPTNPNEFVTVGDDKMVFTWDAATRTFTGSWMLECGARCADYSPDGSAIAVGQKNGGIRILPVADGAVAQSAHDRADVCIEEIKYSPNGKYVAVGTHDQHIDVYKTDGLTRVATCSGHSSTILHIDWSADSTVLQTVSQAYELLWYSPDGSHITSASSVKDTEWHSFTCKFGWPVQGIWPKKAHDKTDVNTVDMSHARDVIATGDDWGGVKLFTNPCFNPGDRYGEGSAYKVYAGHSAHVTKVRFVSDDSRLISTGGGDKSVFQWIYVGNAAGSAAAATAPGLSVRDDPVPIEPPAAPAAAAGGGGGSAFCGECGTKSVSPSDKFCRSCGSRL